MTVLQLIKKLKKCNPKSTVYFGKAFGEQREVANVLKNDLDKDMISLINDDPIWTNNSFVKGKIIE